MPTNKNKPIDPNSPEFWKDFDPFEFDGPKDYVDGKSDAQVNIAHGNRMKAMDPEFREKVKVSMQLKAHDPAYQANRQAMFESAKWKEHVKLVRESLEYQANRQAMFESAEYQANRQAMFESAKWREKNKLVGQQNSQSTKWREKNKLAMQKRCNKQISCDGIIYPSRRAAILALAPDNYKSDQSKAAWFVKQLKKFPERYFYITQSE